MEERLIELEKVAAVERYADLRRLGHSRDTASAFLAASGAFPLLSMAGKHGASAIRVANLDNWSRLLRTGRSLRRQWSRSARPYLPGGGFFWSSFFCLYLKPHGPSLPAAYRLAAKLSRPGNAPTIAQLRHVIHRRVDPVLVAICRGEPLPTALGGPRRHPSAHPEVSWPTEGK